MKIAIITNLYPPFERGGAEIIAQRMANEFSRQGHKVVVITAHPWSEAKTYRPQLSFEGKVKVYRYAVPNLYFYSDDHKFPKAVRLIWHAFDLFNIASARTCKKILKKEHPDLVVTHNLMGLGYGIPKVIRKMGLKHIHILHDIQLAVRSGLMRLGQEKSFALRGPHAKIYQLLVKKLFGSPEVVLSPSDYLRSFYKKMGYFPHSRFYTKRNPIEEGFFLQTNQKSKKQGVTFGYVGQLEPHKGLRELKQAFSFLEDPEARLEIVGSGSLKDEMMEWAEQDSRVEIKGRIPNNQLPQWYQSVDAIILPTLVYENSPTVVYEAFASGIPVIASDIGGAAEMITSTDLGEKVQVGGVEGLSQAIQTVILNHKNKQYSPQTMQASVKMLGVKSYCSDILEL